MFGVGVLPRGLAAWRGRTVDPSSCSCRCDSCHGQAEKLLDSAKEMEDSIAVNLRCGPPGTHCCAAGLLAFPAGPLPMP
jgi:hypothetical protein